MAHQAVSLAKGLISRNALQSAALLFGMLAVFAGAGQAQGPAADPDAIVIKVGPVGVTLQEFSNHFHRTAGDDPSMIPDRSAVQDVLDARVEMLLAYTSTMKDSTVLRRNDVIQALLAIDQIFQRALMDKLLPQYLKADEEVMRAVYDRLSHQLRLATIKVPTLVELEEVQAALDAGGSFDAVARRLSRDPYTAGRGGKMGWLDATSFSLEQQEILWSLPVGGVSAPFAETQFHAIYKVLDKREGPPLGSLDEERSRILRSVQRIELGRAGQELHDDLMNAYNYRVDTEAAEWMREFLHRETAGARRTYDPEKDKDYVRLGEGPTDPPVWTSAPLVGDEAARPVAYIDGDTLSALEVIDELDFLPTITWPTFDSVTDVLNLCDSALYYRVQLMEANRLGLEDDPEIRRKIATRQMIMFWRAYRREKILPKITPTMEELRATYESEIDSYFLPERRRFVLVNTPNQDQANQVVDLFKRGLVPSSVIREIGTPDSDFQVTPDTTAGWATYGVYPSLDHVLFKMSEGEVSDPILDGGRFSVIRLEKISPSHTKEFDAISEDMKRKTIDAREKETVAEMAEAARRDTEVWIDSDAIARMDIDVSMIEQQRSRRQAKR